MAVLRKSGFEDAFFLIVVILTISIFLLILSKAWNDIKTPVADSIESSMPSSDVNITKTFDSIGGTINVLDKLMPFLIIGLFAFVFLGVGLYMQHPIMIFVGVIVLAVAILLGSIYSNIYISISESDEFSSTSMPISSIYMNYLPYIILIAFILIIAAVIYLRSNQGGTSI